MKKNRLFKFIFVLCLVLFSCGKQEQPTLIGFSQCTGGDWREQMNQQMNSEINFYKNINLEIRNANGKIENQIADIHYFIEKKVDILIISPFEDKALVEAFNKIDFKGIPILLIDRNLSSNKHIAFVGASNIEVGRLAAQATLKLLGNRKSKVLLIRGYEKSSVTLEREEGFVKVINSYPNIETIIIDSGKDLDGKDLSETKKIIHQEKDLLKEVDLVYAFNDEMAMIASNEAKKMNLTKQLYFIGVDGRFGYNGGIEAIRKGLLNATIVYPTGGDKVIEIAMKIINKIPVQRNISLPLILINSSNVDSYYQQGFILQDYLNKIEVLHNSRVDVINKMNKQNKYLNGFIIVTVALLLLFVFLLLYMGKKTQQQRILQQVKIRLREKLQNEIKNRSQLLRKQRLMENRLFKYNNFAHNLQDNRKDKNNAELSDILNHIHLLMDSYEKELKKHAITIHLQFDIRYQNILYNVSLVDIHLSTILEAVIACGKQNSDVCIELDSIYNNETKSDQVRVNFILMEQVKADEVKQAISNNLNDDTEDKSLKTIITRNSSEYRLTVYNGENRDTQIVYYFPLTIPEESINEDLDESIKSYENNKEEYLGSEVHNKFKQKIESLLAEFYTDFDFSMSVLAEKSLLSRVQFYRKFKAVYNETPNNYIRKYRLRKAVELIRTEEFNFAEIAYKVGYNSPAYFTKCFKDEYQCTPSDFLSKEKALTRQKHI